MLASVGNTEIQYDSIGNPIQWGEQDGDIWYNGALLEWQGRELQSFQAFNELDGDYMDADYVVYFQYNSDGIRTEKITDAGTHEYILNGSQIVGEWIDNRSKLIVYLYDEAGSPIGMKIRDYTQAAGEFDEYFFEKNLQGDIIAVYNMDGEKIGSYTYIALRILLLLFILTEIIRMAIKVMSSQKKIKNFRKIRMSQCIYSPQSSYY